MNKDGFIGLVTVVIYLFFFIAPILWLIGKWIEKNIHKKKLRSAYYRSTAHLDERLRKYLNDGMAIAPEVWSLNDQEGIAELFFEQLLWVARSSRPVLMPPSIRNVMDDNPAVFGPGSTAGCRLSNFRRAGALVDTIADRPVEIRDCLVSIQIDNQQHDLFNQSINFYSLMDESAQCYKKWRLINVR